MADLYNRAPIWTDYLPAEWQSTINTSPVINALSGYINRRPADIEGASNRIFAQPGDREEQDRNWLLQQARGPSALERMNPVAQDGVNKLGILANFFGPGAKLPPVAPKPTGIRAYHGSPHDFDKFDISKIGTGEGAQAYGRGLYFAENEGVARSYRDDLSGASPYKVSGRDYASLSPGARRYAEFVAKGGDLGPERERVLASLEEARRLVRPGSSDPYGIAKREIADAEAQLAAIDEIGVGTLVTPTTGRMYEVNIKADPDQFLDWDKPLSQQPEGVRKVLTPRLADDFYDANAPVGSILRNELLQPETAQALKNAGVPGTRYLDQGSRAKGDGSRNLVVWDDKLIEILRKYGLLPPVAAGTAATFNQQEPPL